MKQRAGETESGLRRRKTRRRAQQRRSLTEPRPPPNDQELRWKSRQRYSDDSASETDDEEQPSGRFHPQSRPSLGHFLTDANPGVDAEAPDAGSSPLGVHLEPLKANEEQGRSQSTVSNVGTESSCQKDSGFSDLHVRSEEETTLRQISETSLNEEVPEELEHPEVEEVEEGEEDEEDEEGEEDAEGEQVETVAEVEADAVSSRQSSKDVPARQTDREVSDGSRRTFLLRRSKSERRDEPDVAKPHEKLKLKADIPLSVIRATQTKTRKYLSIDQLFERSSGELTCAFQVQLGEENISAVARFEANANPQWASQRAGVRQEAH